MNMVPVIYSQSVQSAQMFERSRGDISYFVEPKISVEEKTESNIKNVQCKYNI